MQQARIPAPARIQEVFDEVLARPEFQERAVAPLVTAVQWLLDQLARFLRWILPSVGEAEVELVAWFLFAGAVGLFLILAWRFVSDRSDGSGKARTAMRPAKAPRDAAGWVRWARAAQQEGRLRDAATGLYQAVVLHLEARGIVRYGQWKTPGDYAVEASRDPTVHPRLRSFLTAFVPVAFGPTDPSPDAVEALFAHAASLGCSG